MNTFYDQKRKLNENIFYTYIYLNPLKYGRYTYGDFVTLFYSPFYVGKGHKERINISRQLTESSYNQHKWNTIKKIKDSGLDVIVLKVIDCISETDSFDLEKFLISLMGRRDLKTGCLTNMTEGGDGFKGGKLSNETKIKLREIALRPDKVRSSTNNLPKNLVGELNPFYEKKHTLETREKMKLGWQKRAIRLRKEKECVLSAAQ